MPEPRRTTHVRPVAAGLLTAALLLASCSGDDADPAAPPTGSTAPTTTTSTGSTTPTTTASTDTTATDPSAAATTTTTVAPGPDPATVVAGLEDVGWWDFAAGFLGGAFPEPSSRDDIAADVIEACAFAEADLAGFDDYLDELARIGERRDAVSGASYSTEAFALVLDAALPGACPEGAAAADRVRPPLVSVSLDELFDGEHLTAIVPDPAPGDLRTDPDADVLPPDYEPGAAHETILDIAYGDDPAQRLDLYLPDAESAPVVMYVHSGGWVSGDKQPVPDMVMRFVERGYAVASVGYRLAPQHSFPAAVHDVKHAVRWLKAYGEREHRVDGSRIVAYGASAGGHLVAFIAATPGSFEPESVTPEEAAFDSSVAGVVSAVGPTDLVSLYVQPHPWAAAFTGAFVGCAPCRDDELLEASPINYLDGDLPPAYWAYGTDDALVEPNSQGAVIAAAWADQAGLYSSFLDLVEGRGHNLWTTINQRFVETFIDFAISVE